jgi:hypothetical protein
MRGRLCDAALRECSQPRAAPLLVPWPSGHVWRVVAAASPRSAAGSSPDSCSSSGSESGSGAGDARSDSTCAEVSCRFCFGEADGDAEGELVSPCACVGTQVRGRCGAWDAHAALTRTHALRAALGAPALPARLAARQPAERLHGQGGEARSGSAAHRTAAPRGAAR